MIKGSWNFNLVKIENYSSEIVEAYDMWCDII